MEPVCQSLSNMQVGMELTWRPDLCLWEVCSHCSSAPGTRSFLPVSGSGPEGNRGLWCWCQDDLFSWPQPGRTVRKFKFKISTLQEILKYNKIWYRAEVLKPVLEDPQHCTFCMSPLSDIYPFQVSHWVESGVLDEGDNKMCSAGGTEHYWSVCQCFIKHIFWISKQIISIIKTQLSLTLTFELVKTICYVMPHLTLICLPLNKDSSSAMAVLTDSLSANSIYANLKHDESKWS